MKFGKERGSTQECHPERSKGSLSVTRGSCSRQRSWAQRRMTWSVSSLI